ncbi:hypothetical protein EYC80_006210 [Monilinia laxa]|uniref:Uncharacterized protein n=1 Tax=Monilinia laxa TaxID=61186 RepID=A0A5N6KGT1_MONLA|nr:hypothetical protein EYC80_006210 [Monilinia laxa]
MVRPAYFGRFQDTMVILFSIWYSPGSKFCVLPWRMLKMRHLQWARCTWSEISGYTSAISLPWALAVVKTQPGFNVLDYCIHIIPIEVYLGNYKKTLSDIPMINFYTIMYVCMYVCMQ